MKPGKTEVTCLTAWKKALQNFTSQVKFIKGVSVFKVNFVLTLHKSKCVKVTFTTAKIQLNITFHIDRYKTPPLMWSVFIIFKTFFFAKKFTFRNLI
jgi:hypothetical protein